MLLSIPPKLPVDIISLAEHFAHLLPYSRLEQQSKNPQIKEVVLTDLFSSPYATAVYDKGSGAYVIFYDDNASTQTSELMWSIGHELGHIKMGHLADFSQFSYKSIPPKELIAFTELEANSIAKELCVPLTVLSMMCRVFLGEINSFIGTYTLLRLFFGTSDKTSRDITYDFITNNRISEPLDAELESHFTSTVLTIYNESSKYYSDFVHEHELNYNIVPIDTN